MTTPDLRSVHLETERLILRTFQKEDLNDFYRYASVDGVGQMAGWLPHKSPEESAEILAKFIRQASDFALVQKTDGRVIGSIGLKEFPGQAAEYRNLAGYELGFALAKDCWGRGLMPEALREVIRYCFENLGCDVLFASHFLRNHQSRRVQEKCGFSDLKMISYVTQYGTVEPACLKKLLREDWITDQR